MDLYCSTFSLNTMGHISLSVEEFTNDDDTSPSVEVSTNDDGGNNYNDSFADNSEKIDPFNSLSLDLKTSISKMKQDLNIERKTTEKVKINVESVICTLCKFMFPGGTSIEDFSEIFFTHLKDDHGILHSHLSLLEKSMVPVIESPTSKRKIEEPKEEQRKKRIYGANSS